MRINDAVKNDIVKYAKEYFSEFHIYLFGSRVDDSKKGGDIDLFIESENEINLTTQMLYLKKYIKMLLKEKLI